MGSTKLALEAINMEQHERIVQQTMGRVCLQLVSEVSRSVTREAVRLEQDQLIARHRMYDVCEQVRRTLARKMLAIGMDREQRARVAESKPKPSSSDATQAVLHDIERRGNKHTAILMMEEERLYRMYT